MTDRAVSPRNIALALGAFAGGVLALAGAAVALGRRGAGDTGGQQSEPAPQPPMTDTILTGPTAADPGPPTGLEGHAAPELAPGQEVDIHTRADPAFRPDIDAPMTPAEREALRPATGPSPSLVSDPGGSTQGVGGDLY